MDQHQQHTAVKVTEQLCLEYEREVQVITEELVLYRTELARCGELLAFQLGREKQLHAMLENIAGNAGTLVATAADVGQKHSAQQSAKTQLHDMVEQMFGTSTNLVESTFNSVSEAHSITHTHLAQAKELQNHAITAENELSRIMTILQQPPIHGIMPAPTVAQVQQAPQPQHIQVQHLRPMPGTPPSAQVAMQTPSPRHQPQQQPQPNGSRLPGSPSGAGFVPGGGAPFRPPGSPQTAQQVGLGVIPGPGAYGLGPGNTRLPFPGSPPFVFPSYA